MKHIVVTGGSHGIGQGIVQSYLEQGWKVTNIDVNANELFATNDLYRYQACDLANHEQLQVVLVRIEKIDAIVLNAAAFDRSMFSEQSIKEWKRILDVNLIAAMIISKHYYNQYVGKQGRIVLISSTRARMSEANTVGYTVSKGGLESLAHSLAITMQDKNITVNAIAPGWIHTSEERLRDQDHRFHPSKRVGTVLDIVRVVHFLIDEESTFINGETITVDGGVTKKMIYPD